MKKTSLFFTCILLLCLLFAATAFAETGRETVAFDVEISIDETNFPDSAFRTLVSAFDTDGSGGLSGTEIMAVSVIDCAGQQIGDLEGLSHFTGLTALNCANNSLTALNLRRLGGVAWLDCSGNDLPELDLSYCPALTALRLTQTPDSAEGVLTYTDGTRLLRYDGGAFEPLGSRAEVTVPEEIAADGSTTFSAAIFGTNGETVANAVNVALTTDAAANAGEIAWTQIGSEALSNVLGGAILTAGEQAGEVTALRLTIITDANDAVSSSEEQYTTTSVSYDVQPMIVVCGENGETLANVPVANESLRGSFALRLSLNADDGWREGDSLRYVHHSEGYSDESGTTRVEKGADGGLFAGVSVSHFSTITLSKTVKNTVTLTYDKNGAASGAVPAESTSYATGSTVTVPGNTGNLTKAGYSFDGWNTKADGSGEAYRENSTFRIDDDTTLYAQWKLAFSVSATLRLTENIDVNFYIKILNEPAATDLYVRVVDTTENREIYDGLISGLSMKEDKYWISSGEIYAYQMWKPFAFTVYKVGEPEEPIVDFTYSVFDYFHSKIDGSGVYLSNLACAALDYGASTQLYFDNGSYLDASGVSRRYETNADKLVNAALTTHPADGAVIPDPETYGTVLNDGIKEITKYNAALLLGSNTALKFSVNGPSFDPNKVKSITCEGNRTGQRTVVWDASKRSFQVTGLKCYELNDVYTIIISYEADDGSVENSVLTYSPYTYARNKWNRGGELSNMVKALVAYGNCAYDWYTNSSTGLP